MGQNYNFYEYFWHLRSVCPRGQACSFAHSESEIGGYSHPQRSPVPPPHHQQSLPRVIVPPPSLGSSSYNTPSGFTSEWSGLSSFSGGSSSNYNNSHEGYTTQGGFGFPSGYNNQAGPASQGKHEPLTDHLIQRWRDQSILGGSDSGGFSFLNRRNKWANLFECLHFVDRNS